MDLDASNNATNDRESLLHSWYAPSKRDAFREKIAAGYKYVIISGDLEFAERYPEHYFEELHVLSQATVKAGSIPVVAMREDASDPAVTATIYRAARGCGMEVIPYGRAIESSTLESVASDEGIAQRAYIGAAGIYHWLTGNNAADLSYDPTYQGGYRTGTNLR